jgi:hypothetical protein
MSSLSFASSVVGTRISIAENSPFSLTGSSFFFAASSLFLSSSFFKNCSPPGPFFYLSFSSVVFLLSSGPDYFESVSFLFSEILISSYSWTLLTSFYPFTSFALLRTLALTI